MVIQRSIVMKSFLGFAALAGSVLAQSKDDSPPFRLFLKSDNATLDGTALGACHQGAAIEGLCITNIKRIDRPTPFTTFYHDTGPWLGSHDEPTQGILTFDLTISSNQSVPSAMRLYYDPFSNVAIPLFFPDQTNYQLVTFSKEGCMHIVETTDDTQSPPIYLPEGLRLENWFVCLTRWGYLFQTLTWKVGRDGAPQNPSCQPVQVVREFIGVEKRQAWGRSTQGKGGAFNRV